MDLHVWEQNELYYDYFDKLRNFIILNGNYNPKIFFC